MSKNYYESEKLTKDLEKLLKEYIDDIKILPTEMWKFFGLPSAITLRNKLEKINKI